MRTILILSTYLEPLTPAAVFQQKTAKMRQSGCLIMTVVWFCMWNAFLSFEKVTQVDEALLFPTRNFL
jgi:hypothetical protein